MKILARNILKNEIIIRFINSSIVHKNDNSSKIREIDIY